MCIRDRLTIANKEHKPYLMVDQIVPPSNIQRFVRYFKDIKVIVVDRDPRDLYILAKYVWKDPVVPCELSLIHILSSMRQRTSMFH